MLLKFGRKYYKRNIKVSLIMSLSLMIFIFRFFPSTELDNKKLPEIQSIIIRYEDIPATTQNIGSSNLKKARPPLPPVFISSEIEDLEIPEDISKDDYSISISENPASDGSGDRINKKPAKRIIPKQILEVLPERNSDNKGTIIISLKIGINGTVTGHIILNNSTNSKDCLEEVIAAAYKSRWEPVTINGEKKEFWINKSYTFNSD